MIQSLVSSILCIDIIFFSIYLVSVLKLFGIPTNLSITYYYYERKYKGLGLLFPALLLLLCASALPIWIIVTKNASAWGANFIMLPYIVLAGLLSVAGTARYKRRPKLIYFHYTCAIIAAICAVIWIFFVAYRIVYIGIGILSVLLFVALFTKTLKKCTFFWLELAAFYAILFTLLIISIFSVNI